VEKLAATMPMPIKFESRRKKIQRFLSLPNLTVEKVWFPILQTLLSTYYDQKRIIYVAMDRTNWDYINLMVVSLIWDKRALPIYFELLPIKLPYNYPKSLAR
jgi:hypothetical protein